MDCSNVDNVLAECLRLKEDANAAWKVVRAYERQPLSPAACAAAAEARERWHDGMTARDGLMTTLVKQLLERATAAEAGEREKAQQLAVTQTELRRAQLLLRRKLGVEPQAMKPGGAKGKDTPATVPAGAETTTAGTTPPATPRRRGAPAGHRGASRPVPAHVDSEEVIPPPDMCPCGCGKLLPLEEFDDVYIEDIPAVCRIVLRQRYRRGRGAGCGTLFRHPEATSGPPVRTGDNLAITLTLLRAHGMTLRRLSDFCTDTLGILLTAPGVLGIINRVCDRLPPVRTEVALALRQQTVLGADETGWHIERKNGYIWCFCNDALAYFHPDRHRAGDVAREVLGENYPGIVTCDFYGAYNWLHTQRCWVHLMGDISEERAILPGSRQLEDFENAVLAAYAEGKRVQLIPTGAEHDGARERFWLQVRRLVSMPVPEGKATTLAARIDKYFDALVAFVDNPEVPPHNNRTERQLRPLVVNRKNSFGSDTTAGARRLCDLHTVIQTCLLNGIRPLLWLRQLLTSPPDTPPSPFAPLHAS